MKVNSTATGQADVGVPSCLSVAPSCRWKGSESGDDLASALILVRCVNRSTESTYGSSYACLLIIPRRPYLGATVAGDFVNKPSDCVREAQFAQNPTHVSPMGAQPALVGLAAPGTCSCASSRASTSLLAGPCILPGLLAHLLETHLPGFPWGSLGSFGPLGPQKELPG